MCSPLRPNQPSIPDRIEEHQANKIKGKNRNFENNLIGAWILVKMELNVAFNASNAINFKNTATINLDSQRSRCQENLERPFWIVYGAFGIVIFLSNIVTIAVFLSRKQMRQSNMNIFLISLAFADVMMALLIIPSDAIFCTGCQYTLTKYCWFFGGARFVVFPATKFNLLAITYDRYLAVLRPLQYKSKMNKTRVYRILFLVWTIPIALALLRNCWQHTTSVEESLRIDRIYGTVLIFAFVAVPVVIMIIVNSMIIKAIRQQRTTEDSFNELSNSHSDDLDSRKQNSVEKHRANKGTISCVLVVSIFIVCWIPRAFYNFSAVFGRPDLVSPLLVKLSLLFLFLQSSVNPFIYSFYRDDFRQALLDLFSRRR